MFKKFLPKNKKFFELSSELSNNILEGAKLLNEMLVKFENFGEYTSKISMIEHKCDGIIHQIVNELNETFITPIDREDIFSLADGLDNVMDSLDVIANRIFIYKVKNPIEYGPQLSEIILRQAEILKDIVPGLSEAKDTLSKLISIKKLETEGDVIFRQAISQLFENEKDPIELIKKKEILEILEKAIDRCNSVGIIIEGIIIKNV
jgi:predicted phosphate transport protein (TIGR00153 family)